MNIIFTSYQSPAEVNQSYFKVDSKRSQEAMMIDLPSDKYKRKKPEFLGYIHKVEVF